MSQPTILLSKIAGGSRNMVTLAELHGNQQFQTHLGKLHTTHMVRHNVVDVLTSSESTAPNATEYETDKPSIESSERGLPLTPHSNSASSDNSKIPQLSSRSTSSMIVTFTKSHRNRPPLEVEPEKDLQEVLPRDRREMVDATRFSTLFSPSNNVEIDESPLDASDPDDFPLPSFFPSYPSSPVTSPFSLANIPERDLIRSPFLVSEKVVDADVADLELGWLRHRRLDVLDETMMDEDGHLYWLTKCFICELSVELLRAIFLGACQEDRLTHPRRSVSALSLSLVCHLWRDIMLSLKEAWASFLLFVQPRDNPFCDQVVPMLELYLRRSGDTPLSFKLYFTSKESKPFLSTLLDHSARWENVSIWFPPNALNGPGNRDFPLLKTLEFGCTNKQYVPIPSETMCYMGRAPSLHTLTIVSPLSYWPVDLKTSHITNFVTVAIPLSLATTYLRRLPSVRSFTYTSTSHFPELLPPLFSHPTLRSICFRWAVWTARGPSLNALHNFLASLAMPSATSIAIDLPTWQVGGTGAPWGKNAVTWPHQEFLFFIQRSACTLQELILSNVNFNAIQLRECLEALPTLRTLELDEPPVFLSGALVDPLTRQSSCTEAALLPMLARLKWRGRLLFSDDDFVKMVESRLWSVPTLTCVDVTFRLRKMKMSAKSRMWALAAGGLEVLISEI